MGWVGSGTEGSRDAGSPATLQQAPSLADEALSDQALSEPAGMEPAPAVGSPAAPLEADDLALEPQPSDEPSPEQPLPEQPLPEQLSPEQLSPNAQAKADLAAALAAQPGGQWIADLTVEPEGTLLRLQLKAGFTTQTASQQQRLAEAWQVLAQGFGFDQLELTDRAGRVLGRQALVGSGMILLSPSHLS